MSGAGRPRTPVGTFGAITFRREGARFVAGTRYRDWDGRLRRIEATGPTRQSAERAVKERIAARTETDGVNGELTADTRFRELVSVWLQDLELEGRLAQSTRELYERDMRTLVTPSFADLALREITVSRVDRFLKKHAQTSYSKAKHAKVVLGLALGLAVRYDAIARNPVQATARLRRPKPTPTALSIEEIQRIRLVVAGWRSGSGLPGPKPDGQLGAIIEVMLGTSARIGEVLALRRCDVNLAGSPPTARICGTIVSPKGQSTLRQDHPKTESSSRRVALPSFAAATMRQRLAIVGRDEEQLLFHSRNGTPLTTNNVRRQLRVVLEAAGISGVTPHAFRRTVATTIHREAGVDLAAALLGHSSRDITIEHYIERTDLVDPRTAAALEALAPE